MSNYASLKATINANIKTNGNQEITGSILNSVLNAMTNVLGAGYQFMGVATPTNPGSNQTPDYRCFYLATTPGTYSHLGGLNVLNGEVAILKYDSSWTKVVTGIATVDQLNQLGQDVFDITGKEISSMLVWSNGFIDSYGNIISSSVSKFSQPFLLKAGHTIACGTRNTNITIIGKVSSDSPIRIGDNVTPIQITSTTDQYEEYSYTASEDTYIVVCVRWSEHSVELVGYATKEVISELKTDIETNQANIGKNDTIVITESRRDYPFKVALKKGDVVSMEASSASNVAIYMQNEARSDLLKIYGGNGFVEKVLDDDFTIDHIVAVNYSGGEFSVDVKVRLNHDAKIYANELKSQVAYNKVFFAQCDSASDASIKTISIDGYDDLQDCRIVVRMTHANTASSPQFKIGNSAAKAFRYNGEPATPTNTWSDNQIIDIFYAASDQVYRSVLWSKTEDDIIFSYDNIQFLQGTILVPTSDSNVYAKLGRQKAGELHIPSHYYFLMSVAAYSDAMYLNKVSDMAWTANDIDIDVDPSLYYLVTMLYDWNIPDNPYEHNLHPADVEWFTYTIKLAGTISEQVKVLIERADAVDSRFEKTDVPSYYKNHIAEKCAEIIAKDQQYGQNGDSFVFITDTHVEVNYCHSASLVREIINNAGERLVIHGGDVIDSNCEKDECAPRARGWFAQFGNIHQFVSLGNHDYNTRGQIVQDPSYDLTSAEMYGVYLKQNEYRVSNPGVKNYYYIDNTTQKIRYYILDIHYFQDLDYKGNNLEISNQLDWLEDSALALGAEWTIVVVYHIHFIGAVRGAYGVLSSATRNALAKRLMDRVDSLIDNPNFPTVAGFITGHTHYDMYDLSTKGYPIIALDCDASYNFDAGGYDQVWSPQRAKGTINEQSLNVIHIDKTSKKILITRIGYERDDTDHPVKLEFSYDPNVPNQPDYFQIIDAS